jgi:nucleoside-diphosphate-sugar epimerase
MQFTEQMTLDTIAVTGGNGKIGSAILEHLNEYGYETVNISRGKQREEISDTYVTTDLLDAGETYGALAKTDADEAAVIAAAVGAHLRDRAAARAATDDAPESCDRWKLRGRLGDRKVSRDVARGEEWKAAARLR